MRKLLYILFAFPMLAFTAESVIESNDGLISSSCGHQHRHHEGPTGPTGPIGPTGPTGPIGPTGPAGANFIIPVPGDTLTATVLVPMEIFSSGGAASNTITPFISTPDGIVLEGTPTLISALPQTLTFPNVNPVFAGTYIYGLLVNSADSINITALTLPVIISSSAAPSSTNTVNIFVPFFILTTSQVQFSAAFVYNPPFSP